MAINMENKILKVENLSVSLDKRLVLDDLNFEIGKGEVMVVVGPNGAGKTVLLRTLLGLVPHAGNIVWGEESKIGYVPQSFSISSGFPLTIKDFFSLKEKNKEEMIEALQAVGLRGGELALNRVLGELSGGELQRALIAYALLGGPNVLFFDEPTRGIDIGGEATIYNLLHTLHVERGLTMIINSHDLDFVFNHATTVLCLNKQKVCFGPPKHTLSEEVLERLYGKEVDAIHHAPHSH